MKKPNEKQNNFTVYTKPNMIYSDFDLIEFDKMLAKYHVEKVLENGVKIAYTDTKAFLIDQKALTPDGAVVIRNLVQTDGKYDCSSILFEQLDNKLQQWGIWKGRQEFGEKMRLKQLEEKAVHQSE